MLYYIYSVSEIYNSYIIQTSYQDESKLNDTEYIKFEYNMPTDIFICINGMDVQDQAVGLWLTKWNKVDDIDYIMIVGGINYPRGQCYYKNLTYTPPRRGSGNDYFNVGNNFTIPAPSYDMKDNETFAGFGYMIALKLHPIIPPLPPEYDDDMDNVKFFLYVLQFGIPFFLFMFLSVCFISKRIV